MTREWSHLDEPPLGHPDKQILWEAELAFQKIGELLDSPDIKNVFVKRLEEHKSALHAAAGLVSGTEYTIAFIGDIGVGKTTAICRATELEVQNGQRFDPALEVGAGGTTICQVHIAQGPHCGILVEPMSESELRREVREFAHYLMSSQDAGRENAPGDQETHGTSKEIERAIRNMSDLRRARVRGEEGRRQTVDYARNLAHQFLKEGRDADGLAIEILSRINLHRRTKREMWHSEASDQPPLLWLKDIFRDVNNGGHPEFSLPNRIDIILPKPTLNEDSLSIRLVDTKGIDGTAEREDLEFYFNDARSITVALFPFQRRSFQFGPATLGKSRPRASSRIWIGKPQSWYCPDQRKPWQ